MSGAKGTGKEGTRAKGGKRPDDEVDALFQLPLSEFTAARNALAARLKKSGDAEQANRVKGIAKPSVAAWAANQLYWQHRAVFDQLLESGERFRKAQASQLAGKSADFRAPLQTRRAALSELSGRAAELLTSAGNSPTPDTMRRITTTLEALSTYSGLPDTPQPGRLIDDVQPPGFETLAALVPRIDTGDRTAGPTRVIPFQHKQPQRKAASKRSSGADDEQTRAAERKARLAQAKAVVQEAERTLRDARKTAQRAEEDLKKAAARAKEADAAKKKAEQHLEQVTADADAARKTARTVAAQAEEAAQAVEDAERSLDKATRELSAINADS